MEKPASSEKTKTKRKKKQKEKEVGLDTEGEDIGRCLEAIKERNRGSRPEDDLTKEIADGPQDNDSSSGDDDEAHTGIPVPTPRPTLGQAHDCRPPEAQHRVHHQPAPHPAPWLGHCPHTGVMSQLPQLPGFHVSHLPVTAAPTQAPPTSQVSEEVSETQASAKKKSRKEKTEERNALIAQQLLIAMNFKFKDRDKLTLVEECLDSGPKEHQGNCVVAKCIEVGNKEKGAHMKIDLELFSCKDIRKIAANFDCKSCGNISKFECRRRMAVRKTAGAKCDQTDVPNPFTGSKEKLSNTAC